MSNDSGGLEARMAARKADGIRWLIGVLVALVYAGFITYAEYHYYLVVVEFLPADALSRMAGIAAIVVTGLSSIAFPLADLFWARPGRQQIALRVGYALHLGIVFANLVVSSSAHGAAADGRDLGSFFEIYALYVLPAVVVLEIVAWVIFLILDPSAERREKLREAAEAAEAARLERLVTAESAKDKALALAWESPQAKEALAAWAARNAPRLLSQELGIPLEELGSAGESWRYWEERPAPGRQLQGPDPRVGTRDNLEWLDPRLGASGDLDLQALLRDTLRVEEDGTEVVPPPRRRVNGSHGPAGGASPN